MRPHVPHSPTCGPHVGATTPHAHTTPVGGVGGVGPVWVAWVKWGGLPQIFASRPGAALLAKNFKNERKGLDMAIRIQRNPKAVWRAIKAYGTQEDMAGDLGV